MVRKREGEEVNNNNMHRGVRNRLGSGGLPPERFDSLLFLCRGGRISSSETWCLSRET